MKDILTAPFMEEMRKTTANMYRLGWDERNGGNISYLLDMDEVAAYLDLDHVIRTIPMGFDASALIGKIFIVTGTGKYFKNVDADPGTNLGIVRIAADGCTAELLWGFADGGRFFPDYPIAILIVFALCALLIGIRGRRGVERLSVLVGITMLILALVAVLAGGGRGETQKSLILLAMPAVSTAACCTAAVKPNTVGALAGVGTSFLLYLALYFAYGNALLTELAVLTGAIFRAAVLVYAALKTVIPRLSVR